MWALYHHNQSIERRLFRNFTRMQQHFVRQVRPYEGTSLTYSAPNFETMWDYPSREKFPLQQRGLEICQA